MEQAGHIQTHGLVMGGTHTPHKDEFTYNSLTRVMLSTLIQIASSFFQIVSDDAVSMRLTLKA